MQNQEQEFMFSEAREQAFDVKAFLWGYLRYWYWFVLALVLCVLGAWLYLRYTVPEYQAFGKLLIKEGKTDQVITEEALLQDLGIIGSTSNLVNEIEILKSRSLMRKVVDQLGLAVRYSAVGRFKATELFGNLPMRIDTTNLNIAGLVGQSYVLQMLDTASFTISKGEESLGNYRFGEWVLVGKERFKVLRGQSGEEVYAYPLAVQFVDPDGQARSYANKIEINTVRDRASVLGMTLVDWSGPKAAAIINQLIEVYNQAAIDDNNKVAKNTLVFIEDRLDFLTLELAAVEGDVERYKTNNNIGLDLGSRATDVLGRVTVYEEEIATINIQIDMLQSLLQQVSNPERSFQLLPVAINEDNGELNSQISSYNELILQYEQFQGSAGQKNPLRINLEDQINELRLNIIANIQRFIGSLERTQSQVESKYQDLKQALNNVPRAERELLEKMRQQIIKENLFLYLLQKREETALSLAVTVPNSRVVDPAEASPSPISPVPFNVMALAVFLGLSLPIGVILGRQLLDDKIREEKDINDFSDVPIIGGISESGNDAKIVVSPQSRTGIAEMFRLIRTNLRFMIDEQQTPTILVTSSDSGEGKTFVCINLGMSMAISNKRTLVIGLDLRKPQLGTYLEEEDISFGLSNYIINEQLAPEDIIRTSAIHDKLHFATSGPIPPNPAELIMTDRMERFIQYAQENYDFVIIDTPPVGLVADAFLLNKFISNSLYIIGVGKTRKSAIPFLDAIYQKQKLNKLACVLNGIPRGNNYGYGYSYGYGGYSNSSGYGYFEDGQNAKKWWQFWK